MTDDPSYEKALRDWGSAQRSAAGEPPQHLLRPTDGAPHRRRWVQPLAAAASVVAVTAVVVAAATALQGPPAGSTADGTAGATPTVTMQPFTGDEHLEVVPRPDATPALTREQAEVIMLNSWPPPPLRDNAEGLRIAGPATVTLASVRLSDEVARNSPLDASYPLAWVVSWTEPDGPRSCPSGDRPTYSADDMVVRLRAYVLSADGRGAYSYSGQSASCATQQDAPEIAVPRAQVAVNRISIPWRAERRDESGDLIFDFDYPACGTYSGQGHDDGWIVVAEVPVGASCDDTKPGTQRFGPVEPPHGPLGPFRDVNGRRQPLLTE